MVNTAIAYSIVTVLVNKLDSTVQHVLHDA